MTPEGGVNQQRGSWGSFSLFPLLSPVEIRSFVESEVTIQDAYLHLPEQRASDRIAAKYNQSRKVLQEITERTEVRINDSRPRRESAA